MLSTGLGLLLALARTVQAVPVAPGNLSVTATQAHAVTLAWDTDADPGVHYRVYTATGPFGKLGLAGSSDWTLLASVSRSAGTTSFSYTDASGEDYVWYHVRAWDGSGESTASPLGFKVVKHLAYQSDRPNIHWVALPKRSIYKKASDIVARLGAAANGTPINLVGLWKPNTQVSQGYLHVPGFGFLGTDFDIDPSVNPGSGVYVGVSANADWVIAGTDASANFVVNENVSMSSQAWLGIPYSTGIRRAADLVQLAGSGDGSKLTLAGLWRPETQVALPYLYVGAPE